MQCPVCQANNTERTCRRCRADLGLLWDLEATRSAQLAEALDAWRQGKVTVARRAAELAAQTRDGPDATRWCAVTALVSGDFESALTSWRRLKDRNA